MIHILGASRAPSVVVFESRKGVTTRWWVSRGVLHYENSDEATGEIASYQEAYYRLLACVAMQGVSTAPGVECDAHDRAKINKFIAAAGELLKTMREHGTPYDRLKDAGILREGGQLSAQEIAADERIRYARKCVHVNSKYFD